MKFNQLTISKYFLQNIRIIVIFIIISCGNSNEKKEEINPYYSQFDKIYIDGNSISDTVDISEIIDSIRIIKIEETDESIIGGIEKVFTIKNNYIIYDRFFSNKIVIYDDNGQFIKNLVEIGSGPEEISKLSDVWISENGGIEVYDNQLNKVLVYDSNYNVSKSIYKRNSNYYGSLMKIPGKPTYISFSGYNGFQGTDKYYKLAFLDSLLNIYSVSFPYNNEINKAMISTPINPFYLYKDTIGFTQNFDPSIYNITSNGEIIKKFELIYKTLPFPTNFEKELITNNLNVFKSENINFDEIKKIFSGYTGFSGPWLETSKYAVFRSYDLNNDIFTSIYSKKNKEIINQAYNFSETINYHMQIPPYFYATDISENRFVCIYEGYIAIKLLKNNSPFFKMVSENLESFYIIEVKLK